MKYLISITTLITLCSCSYFEKGEDFSLDVEKKIDLHFGPSPVDSNQ